MGESDMALAGGVTVRVPQCKGHLIRDNAMASHDGHCRAFVFPGLEDFGITPLEATAAGRPVVAYRAGGVLDTVREELNGVFFAEQTTACLAEALNDPRLDASWDEASMVDHALAFALDRFRGELAGVLADLWQDHAAGMVAHG